MDPDEVPPCGPGQLTTTPTDCELYGRGYIEVPKNCPGGNCGPGGAMGPGGPVLAPAMRNCLRASAAPMPRLASGFSPTQPVGKPRSSRHRGRRRDGCNRHRH